MDERRSKIEDRAVWLRKSLLELRRSIGRAPWVLLGVVLALPVGLLWGIAPALLVVVMAVSLAFTVWYVAWIHYREYEMELDGIRHGFARLTRIAGEPAKT